MKSVMVHVMVGSNSPSDIGFVALKYVLQIIFQYKFCDKITYIRRLH